MELAGKYSGVRVDWQKEIADYANWLKENEKSDGITGATTNKTVEIKKPAKPVRPAKVKGFPFDTQTAAARQAAKGETTRRLTITPDIHIDLVWIQAAS